MPSAYGASMEVTSSDHISRCSLTKPATAPLDQVHPRPLPTITQPNIHRAPWPCDIDPIEQPTPHNLGDIITLSLSPLAPQSCEFDLTGVEYQENTDTLNPAFCDNYLISSYRHYDLD